MPVSAADRNGQYFHKLKTPRKPSRLRKIITPGAGKSLRRAKDFLNDSGNQSAMTGSTA
jgi:hypothetical protein|tara:strand:- start:6 stop:182 length:177 start_codon:yes stop_codon:yes gene_type:complete